jgi:hypothetical protein
VVRRIPLLYGSRMLVATAADDAVVLAPPAPPERPIADVGAAVRDALRFPLAGASLETIVPRDARATILVEAPGLPIPAANRTRDPRHAAVVAAADELEHLGVRSDRQTILVAAGLARRPSKRVVESLVTPEFALRFRGEVAVHDAEDETLVKVGEHEGMPLKVNRAVAESDVVVLISAAVTVLHGGPATLLAASSADAIRGASAESLLEAHLAPGWELALALERAIRRRTPLVGVSLALDLPRFAGALRGYPYEAEAVERVARSRLARAFRLVPAALRARALAALPLELTTSAVFAGPPSVAHAEALVRSVETGSVRLEEPLDAICIGVPRTTPFLPRERPNALIAATLALGYTLRLWRSEFPVRPGGTVVLVNPLRRRFAFPTQQPYRTFFQATRSARNSMLLLEAERTAAADPRAIQAYRDGHTCHPRLPFADWDSCRPALERVGAVFVAGCRDAAAARQLGFVPTHGVAAALEMARGLAGGEHRVGFLLSPPYFPLRVGG